MGVSENRGTLCWGSCNKDTTIQGARLGSPIFRNPLSGLRGCGTEFGLLGTLAAAWQSNSRNPGRPALIPEPGKEPENLNPKQPKAPPTSLTLDQASLNLNPITDARRP